MMGDSGGYGPLWPAWWRAMVLAGTVCLWMPRPAVAFQVTGEGTALEMLTILTNYRAGAVEDAALAWQHLAQDIVLVAKADDNELQELAGLGFVLASLGWDRLGDPRAFHAWQASLETFLRIGVVWDEVVAQKMAAIASMEENLAAVSPGDQNLVSAPVQLNAETLLWIELEKRIAISNYRGPESQLPAEGDGVVDATGVDRPSAPAPFLPSRVTASETTGESGAGAETSNPGEVSGEQPVLPDRGGALDEEDPLGLGESTSSERGFDSPQVTSASGAVYRQPTQAFLDEIAQELGEPSSGGEASETGSLPDAESLQSSAGMVPDTQQLRSSGDPFGGRLDGDLNAFYNIPPDAGSGLPEVQWRHPQSGSNAGLSQRVREAAEIAWRYMTRNVQEETGLVDAVEGYPFATVWDIASGLAAMVCAHGLGLIPESQWRSKLDLFLKTLETMPLYGDELPNREYGTKTVQMTGLNNRFSDTGSGWSAIDVGRLLTWLAILKRHDPRLESRVNAIVNGWNLLRICREGQLFGGFYDGEKEVIRQEGRLGYEQYAANGFALWNAPVTVARNLNFDGWTDVEGLVLPVDHRNLNYLTSEPFFLACMEHDGLAPEYRKLSGLIYQVQKRRWQRTGQLTAVSEDAIARYPWFVYNCVVFGASPWVCVDRSGHPRPALKSLSTKASWAWGALVADGYSELLLKKAGTLFHPEKAFMAGEFENGVPNQSQNINTNAVVLEAIYLMHRAGLNFSVQAVPP